MNSWKHSIRALFLIVLIPLTVASCASLGLGGMPEPETLDERVEAVDADFTMVLAALNEARDAGLIKSGSDLEDQITAAANTASGTIDSAKAALRQGDVSLVESLLIAATSAVAELQNVKARIGQ